MPWMVKKDFEFKDKESNDWHQDLKTKGCFKENAGQATFELAEKVLTIMDKISS